MDPIRSAGIQKGLLQALRFLHGKERKFLHGKGAAEPGREMTLTKGSLDQKRARAAAGIIERHAGTPGAELHKGGSQRLPQGRFTVPRPVSPAGKGGARSIQQDPNQIGMNRNMNRELRAIFRKNSAAGTGLQPLQDGFLRDGLTVPRTHELTAGTLGRDMEEFTTGSIPLPRNGGNELKEGIKGTAFRFREKEIHPIAKAERKITGIGLSDRTLKTDETVFRPDIFQPEAAQLRSDSAFQAEG